MGVQQRAEGEWNDCLIDINLDRLILAKRLIFLSLFFSSFFLFSLSSATILLSFGSSRMQTVYNWRKSIYLGEIWTVRDLWIVHWFRETGGKSTNPIFDTPNLLTPVRVVSVQFYSRFSTDEKKNVLLRTRSISRGSRLSHLSTTSISDRERKGQRGMNKSDVLFVSFERFLLHL